MKKAREYFVNDKLKGKLICKVIISGDETTGTVKYCNKELSDNGNTSSMNGHLKACHKNIKFLMKNNEEASICTPSTIKNALLNKNHYDFESERYKVLTESILDFLAETNQPLSIVDNPSFIKMLNKFDSKYKIPGRQTITDKYLKEKFENVKKSIESEIDEIEYLSITLDGWSSVANNPYLGNQ